VRPNPVAILVEDEQPVRARPHASRSTRRYAGEWNRIPPRPAPNRLDDHGGQFVGVPLE